MRTDDLIAELAGKPWPFTRPALRLAFAMLTGWIVALVGLVLFLGAPLAAVSQTGTTPFALKLGYTTALTLITAALALAAGTPGRRLGRQVLDGRAARCDHRCGCRTRTHLNTINRLEWHDVWLYVQDLHRIDFDCQPAGLFSRHLGISSARSDAIGACRVYCRHERRSSRRTCICALLPGNHGLILVGRLYAGHFGAGGVGRHRRTALVALVTTGQLFAYWNHRQSVWCRSNTPVYEAELSERGPFRWKCSRCAISLRLQTR